MGLLQIVASYWSFLLALFTPLDFVDDLARVPSRYYCGGHVIHVERDYGMSVHTFDRHGGIGYAYYSVWIGRDGELDDICRRTEIYTVKCGKFLDRRYDGRGWNIHEMGCSRYECPTCPLAETGELIEDGE